MTPDEHRMLVEVHAELRSLRSASDAQFRTTKSLIEGLPAKIRATVYTARDSLATLIRDLHG